MNIYLIINNQDRYTEDTFFCTTYILHVTTQEKVPQSKSTRKKITLLKTPHIL